MILEHALCDNILNPTLQPYIQRKMRKMARLAAEGQITLKEFQTQYKSWRGDKKRYHAYRTLRRLDSEERKLEKWIKSTHST